jgi:hypothetical protein
VDSDGNVEIRMPDKATAVQLLSKMTGWFEPEKLQITRGDSFSAYLAELRAMPIGCGPAVSMERGALPPANGGNGEADD